MMETPDSVQVFSDKYLENISDAFKTLYNEEQLSDVTIYCREGSLKAHKLILAASSPYFYKIFRENRNEFPILILHGTSLNQMKNLIDLLYSGITDVKNNDLEALYTLVREFEIKGVSFGPKSSSSNVRLEMSSSHVSPEGSHNRDTRFKGQKRVAVDYIQDEISQTHLPSTSRDNHNEIRLPKKANIEDIHMEESAHVKREIASPAPTESTILSSSDTSISNRSLHMGYSENKLTAWAKKQRKFKCDLCPSSFKRSSHLSRHQLVHTGERPYSCDKCDKAFSRHDKLKHHMRKAHEFIPDSMYEKIDNDPIDSDLESNNINYASPTHNTSENGLKSEYCDLSTPKSSHRDTPPLFTISHISSILEDSFVSPPKKGRGRPRKYPPPTASPAVLNSNQELPISNDMKANEKVDNWDITANGEKARKDKNKSRWFDTFVEENKNNTTSRVLRKRRNIDNNEDSMFFRKAEEEMRLKKEKGLFCQICDKSFIYQGRLKLHMKKIHGIIDNSQKGQFISNNILKDNLGNISPPVLEAEKDLLFAISSVCSLNDSKKQKFEGKDAEKEDTIETYHSNRSKEAGAKSVENFTYEQLRELLPKECSLQPIVEVVETDHTQSDIGTKYCSEPLSTKDDGENLTQGPHMFVISSLLEGETLTPIEEKKEISQGVKASQISKDIKIKKKNRRKRGTRYARMKRLKLKSDQPAFKHQEVKFLANTSSNCVMDHSLVSNIEDSTSLNIGSQTSPFKIPQLNSAIEISIVNPMDEDSSTMISRNKKIDEDLSIIVIDTSDGKKFPDCNLNSQSDLSSITNKHTTNSINQSNDLDSTTSDPMLQGQPKMPQYCVSSQSSRLPKRKRGRPRKENPVVVAPIVKRGRGRPRCNVYPGRPGVQNYNITNLPYGDLDYLTSQTRTGEDEEAAVMMEPLVEINMDQSEQSDTSHNIRIDREENMIESSMRMEPVIIEPVVQIAEQNVKTEHSDDGNNSHENIDISEIETKIGLIGECTISVAN